MTATLDDKISILHNYSACDVSDALLKLQKPPAGQVARAGYLADIVAFAPTSAFTGGLSAQPKVIGPASTIKLVDKSEAVATTIEKAHAVPPGTHWVDNTRAGSVLVIEQPEHQTCAAIGGIMATRMAVRGLAGCVVGGRVRDLQELAASKLPVWAAGRSTVGTGAEARVYGVDLPVRIRDVDVKPGDIVFCDPLEGVVVIPQALLDEVLELMPQLVSADDKVKEAVLSGTTVKAAFDQFRTFDPSK